MRIFLVIALLFSFVCSIARQSPANLSKYTGKYAANGMVVQVAIVDKKLALIVPGAPVQALKPAGVNKYQSASFADEVFLFTERSGKIEEMVSQRGSQSLTLKKISDTPDDFNKK